MLSAKKISIGQWCVVPSAAAVQYHQMHDRKICLFNEIMR